MRVLDADLQPVPDGEVGELCVGGAGLARGYFGRPDLTAERFVPDPQGPPGARLYRTGDLCSRRPDGAFDYRGRIDRQQKIRGFRVEPEEIEATLSRHPSVIDCAVVIRNDDAGTPRIVAYVAASDAVAEDDLLAYAAGALPAYMVPSAVVVLDSLPITANGKLDHAALPKPKPRTPKSHPRDEIERSLVELWERVLGRICGTDEDFFAVGGNSLAAVELRLLIEQQFGCQVAASVLVERPTITAQGDFLRGQVDAPTHRELIEFHPGAKRPPLIMCAPVSGSALCYLTVSRLLGESVPLVGLQAPGLDGRSPPLSSIEELARHHVDAILERFPEGPYIIGGWSLGGTIAFEMARQLSARGIEVAHMILIDATAPAVTTRGLEMMEGYRQTATDALYVNNFARCLALPATFREEELAALEPNEQRREVIEALRKLGAPDLGDEAWGRHLDVFRTTLAALFRYQPVEPYQGDVTALRAAEGHPVLGSDTSVWREHVGSGYRDSFVPGNHFTVLTGANAKAVADELVDIYEEVMGKGGATDPLSD